ncbi:MAG: FtsX-like permease family protein [Rhodospirillaceae bacterium]|nr:FtsX-like permease family protein [Rhodospirillaceae bacterium]
MRYEFKVAARYLASSKFQTGLLIGGVGVGVLVFSFMSALINGLTQFQIDQTVGSIAHVVIEPTEREPRILPAASPAVAVLPAVQRSNIQREQIRFWQNALDSVERDPATRVAVPVVAGNGLIARGQAVQPVSITGVRPEQLSEVAAIAPAIVAGTAELDLDGILIGARLAKNLSVTVGQPLVIRSDRGRERNVRVRGIFSIGIESLDERVAYMNFKSAKALLDLDHGISRIDVKLNDLNAAPTMAEVFRGATGLKATSWTETNRRLFDAIEGQGSTGALIKFFSIVTIVIGVASALLLTSVRRKPEIGIMRSMGVTKGFITKVFVLQGVLVGFLGALVGAGAAYGFCVLVAELARKPDGTPIIPVDPALGNYTAGILLATIASAIAAILPARAAAKVDPVEAISQ